MTDEKKDQRVTIMMSESELRRLDDWAFEQRIRSRGEAIRRLIANSISAPNSKRQENKTRSPYSANRR